MPVTIFGSRRRFRLGLDFRYRRIEGEGQAGRKFWQGGVRMREHRFEDGRGLASGRTRDRKEPRDTTEA